MTCYPVTMADHSSLSAADRIDRALTRIEAALARRAGADGALAKRHAALRRRVEEAIEALDLVIDGEES